MNNWLLQNASLPFRSDIVDIQIQDGVIRSIAMGLPQQPAAKKLDLEGRLVIPGFVDAHMHLDKAYALESGMEAGESLESAIASFCNYFRNITPDVIYQNAHRVAEQALLHGTVALRTHVTVNDQLENKWLEPLVYLRQQMALRQTIQIVAFLDTSILTDIDIALDVSRRALENGADLIGAAPAVSTDYRRIVDMLFNIAQELGCDLDLHIDESDDPKDNSLEYLAEQKIKRHFGRVVTAGHCCSLSAADESDAQRIINKVADAGIQIITLPLCNLYLMGRQDRGLVRRGLTRVRNLLSAGVNVACASDNIRDAFNPYGKADMLQVMLVAGLALQIGGRADFNLLLNMGTYNPARIMKLPHYGIEPGCTASFVVLDEKDWSNAVARQTPCRYVFSQGQLVATTVVQENLL